MIVAGLDVAFSNDYMALVVVEKDPDGTIRLEHLATWKKFDWQSWKQDMKSKLEDFDIYKIYVDKTNNQNVVMELANIGIPVEGVVFSNSAKHDMIRNATKLIVTKELVMPKISTLISQRQKKLVEELYTQLREQEYSHETSRPKLSHPSGAHDDLLWALCLALYGLEFHTPSEPLVMGFDYSDYQAPAPSDNALVEDLLKRIPPGVTITDIKIKMPSDL
jgi:hypothetical protein